MTSEDRLTCDKVLMFEMRVCLCFSEQCDRTRSGENAVYLLGEVLFRC